MDDYADDARVDGAIRLIEQMEMQFTYSLVARATALDKLETLVYERGAGALDATLMSGLMAFQQLYETQIESTNRMAMMAARSNLVQAQQAAKEKVNVDERVSADTRKHELQRSEWYAEKAALRAQLELATAANESYEAAAQKSKTRLLAKNHEYRQLQRELDAQQAAAAVQKAEADQRIQELQRELHVAHKKQAAAQNQLTALRLEARPQQPAAPTANASATASANANASANASARTNAARPGRPNRGIAQGANPVAAVEPAVTLQNDDANDGGARKRGRQMAQTRSTIVSELRRVATIQERETKKNARDAARAKDMANIKRLTRGSAAANANNDAAAQD